jgi:hypothetical protein
MTKFKRYRDGNGSEFSSAVSDELAQAKGWADVTSADNPAADRQGRPLPAKPAGRMAVAQTAKPRSSTTSTAGNTAANTSTEA